MDFGKFKQIECLYVDTYYIFKMLTYVCMYILHYYTNIKHPLQITQKCAKDTKLRKNVFGVTDV